MPRDMAAGIAIPAARLGLLARGESVKIIVAELGVEMTLAMNDEGDLIIAVNRELRDHDAAQLELFS